MTFEITDQINEGEKYGYQEVFALEENPLTGKRYFFTKTL